MIEFRWCGTCARKDNCERRSAYEAAVSKLDEAAWLLIKDTENIATVKCVVKCRKYRKYIEPPKSQVPQDLNRDTHFYW